MSQTSRTELLRLTSAPVASGCTVRGPQLHDIIPRYQTPDTPGADATANPAKAK